MASLVLSNLLATLKSTFRINKATIDASGLSVARTITFPDASFTVAGYFAATQRVLARNSGGAGSAEEVTASQLLDWLSSTQGVILYRGASGWAALSPGTSGYVLQSNGSGADPSWVQMNASIIDTGNSSTATLTASSTFTGTGLSTLGYGSVSLVILASHASAANGVAVEQSMDNTNWDIADYIDVAANQAMSFTVNFAAEFYRVVFVNGGTNQTTFRLEAKLNPQKFDFPNGERSNAPSKSAIVTLTTTSDTDVVAAPGSNLTLLIRIVKSYNTSATLTRVDLKDGTTAFAYLAGAASGGGEVYKPAGRKFLTENTAFKAALSVAVTDVRISAEYVVVKS